MVLLELGKRLLDIRLINTLQGYTEFGDVDLDVAAAYAN